MSRSYKYPLLNDKNWLYKKYIEEKLGTIEICKLADVKTPNSVRQALIRFNIPIRSIGEGLRANEEDDGFIIDSDIINGCLLGDGYLQKWNKESENSYPYFAKRNKYYDHIKFVAQKLFRENWQKRIRENNEKNNGKKYTVFSLRSLSNKKLFSFYEKWYPSWNNYKKVIPEDIEITPTLLLHWFLDDGSSYQRRKDSTKKQIIVTLCSECFEKENQQMIINKIKDKFNIECRLRKVNYGTGYQIVFNQSQSYLFYDIIGECPIPSMEYKWKF